MDTSILNNIVYPNPAYRVYLLPMKSPVEYDFVISKTDGKINWVPVKVLLRFRYRDYTFFINNVDNTPMYGVTCSTSGLLIHKGERSFVSMRQALQSCIDVLSECYAEFIIRRGNAMKDFPKKPDFSSLPKPVNKTTKKLSVTKLIALRVI